MNTNKKPKSEFAKKIPSFLCYPGDINLDIKYLTQEEKGYYLDLVLTMLEFGPLTKEEALRFMPRDFDKIFPHFERFFLWEKGRFYISWVQQSRERKIEISQKRQKSGVKSGEARNTKKTNNINNEQVFNKCSTSVEQTEKEKEKEKAIEKAHEKEDVYCGKNYREIIAENCTEKNNENNPENNSTELPF